jgi:hypothetical protein
MNAMTPAPQQPQAPRPSAPQKRTRRPMTWLPTKSDVIIILLALNLIGLIGLAIRVYTAAPKPMVVTVGVRQLTGEYLAKISTTNITPEEAGVRTQLFLSVAQDALRRLAVDKGVVIMARECVLGGEYSDVTDELSKSVEKKLNAASGGLAAAVPAAAAPPAAFPAPAAAATVPPSALAGG